MKRFSALLIEDNMTIARQIDEFFTPHNWTVDHASTGKLGITLACENIYDAVILDLNLPDVDGIKVCQLIKQGCPRQVPIIMLTARDSIDDKILGLANGADDYLTKPFNLRELVLRCQSLSRRQHLHQDKTLRMGPLEIDTSHFTALRDGRSIELTRIGFSILLQLALKHPSPVSRSTLIHEIWGDEPPQSDALKSHIYALRQALDSGFDKPLLITMPQIGFRLDIQQNVSE